MSDIAIKVEGIGKKYRIGQKKSGEFRETFGNILRSFRPAADSQQPAALKEFWALKDISFEVKQGEAVGIIGRNGAGKSTLLKVLSRITKPTTGRFEINGRVSSLLEVGTGFHPELTGRENIFLNGTILGMRRAEIKAKFDEIIAFSGVEEFIDTPVKHYSSGMKVRLAFSVAAHLEPEILIIDEVLAVGDAEFQKKCLGKMEDVTGEGRTVLFVSHNMGAISRLCSQGLYIETGMMVLEDKMQTVVDTYLNSNQGNPSEIVLPSTDFNCFEYIGLFTKSGSIRGVFKRNEAIKVTIRFHLKEKDTNLALGLAVLDQYESKIFTTVQPIGDLEKGQKTIEVLIPDSILLEGFYHLDLAAFIPNKLSQQYLQKVLSFRIEDEGSDLAQYKNQNIGVVNVDCKWKINEYA
jgi:lipopolysaccharide transport system ATP-binding protein